MSPAGAEDGVDRFIGIEKTEVDRRQSQSDDCERQKQKRDASAGRRNRRNNRLVNNDLKPALAGRRLKT
jgi:hypothetical protein